jgi:hypothetical protein
MASLVYAVFEDATAAEEASAELTRNTTGSTRGHPSFAVQTHHRGPLDGDDLPESATEIGRNTMIAIVAGAIGGLVVGLAAGTFLDIMGLTPAIGAVFGLLTGILSGMLGGMMAGTRRPKAALREAAAALESGEVLLTIEVGDPGHVDVVEEILDQQGAIEIDVC